MAPVDWIIVAVYVVGCVGAGVWMRRYIRNVDDFAVAGREMDVNLGVASLAATEVGIVTIMYTAQMGFTNGLAGATPGVLTALAMFLVGVTGFVIVPMRNAGVMTIPELFEKRFGKRVRWLAGLVVILGGVLNMGIFLRVGGQFLMHVTGFDPDAKFTVSAAGLDLQLGCLEVIMTALLALVLVYTVLGGMVSVLITDYLQFLVMGLGIVIVSVLVIWNVGWSNLLDGLDDAHYVSSAGTIAQQAQEEAQQAAKRALAAGRGVEDVDRDEIEAFLAGSASPPGGEDLADQVALAALAATEARAAAGGPSADPSPETAEEAKLLAEAADGMGGQVTSARKQAAEKARQVAEQSREVANNSNSAAQAASKARTEAEKAEQEAKTLILRAKVAEAVAKLAAAKSGPGAAEAARSTASAAAKARAKAKDAAIVAARAETAKERTSHAALTAAEHARDAYQSAKAAGERLQLSSGGLKLGNPFNPVAFNSLGWGWVIWQALTAIAVVTTWQTTIARVLAAKNAHAAKQIYRRTSFYFVGRFALPGLWGAAALLYFWSHGGLPKGLTDLTAMPTYLQMILPAGLLGIVIAAMLAAEMSTDSGYLLTWATVIYNDLISPCLRRPMSARAKLFTVRALVLAIGGFLIFWGLWYVPPGGTWDYLAITGNIYLASLSTLLVGALYWRGANSWGAIAAIVLGATGPLSYVFVNFAIDKLQLDPAWKISAEASGFAAFGLAFVGMFFGSMLGRAMGHAGPVLDADQVVPKEMPA